MHGTLNRPPFPVGRADLDATVRFVPEPSARDGQCDTLVREAVVRRAFEPDGALVRHPDGRGRYGASVTHRALDLDRLIRMDDPREAADSLEQERRGCLAARSQFQQAAVHRDQPLDDPAQVVQSAAHGAQPARGREPPARKLDRSRDGRGLPDVEIAARQSQRPAHIESPDRCVAARKNHCRPFRRRQDDIVGRNGQCVAAPIERVVPALTVTLTVPGEGRGGHAGSRDDHADGQSPTSSDHLPAAEPASACRHSIRPHMLFCLV